MDISIQNLPKELILKDKLFRTNDFDEEIWFQPVKRNEEPVIKIIKEINWNDQISFSLYYNNKQCQHYYIPKDRVKTLTLKLILEELLDESKN